MKDTEAAWLAGLIDGEGAIWCRWPKRCNVVIEIKMTHLPTLKEVQRIFPGRLVQGQLTAGGLSRLPQWRWTLDTLGAKDLLHRIEPFMITKKFQAYAAFRLCDRPVRSDSMDYWASALKRGTP